jgi:hypothetical protein
VCCSQRTQFTVYANNSGGSSLAYVNVTIIDEVPALSYSPENLTLERSQDSSDLPLSPTLTGPGTITSWAISPALPSGLFFGTSNGTVWGTPWVLQLNCGDLHGLGQQLRWVHQRNGEHHHHR